ncbi:MAG: hypothetical protein J6A21_07800 [Lentisphaeria bacterium]|nr:hypothetical protein [Lentisphaeria bacterium]
MDTDQQIIVRIKSFLNSAELLDSPTARELYNAYCKLNNEAAQRLVECEVLLQRKQKIEAVVLAQQEPNLFQLIDVLFAPERKELLLLADLYDWPFPDEIDRRSVDDLQEAVAAMDDLRPLLTEFRRIARTDQVKNKLHLLREIARIDKGNSEWVLPLKEVENQYVSQLISEAQEVIQRKDFDRLERIHDEFKNTRWAVDIPTIVLQKVEKIVLQHREEEAKKKAATILEKINNAYASFDITALEDALICWQEHCRAFHYTPDKNEEMQLKEAASYLEGERKKLKEQREFQDLLEHVTALMDTGADLPQVEKCFAKIHSSGLAVPEYLEKRVGAYRRDIERERRTAAILKGLKIAGSAAVVLLLLGASAVWIAQSALENAQARNLSSAIEEGKIVEAQSILAEIRKRYPKLAGRPKITRAIAALHELEKNEAWREKDFRKALEELEELKKQGLPDDTFRGRLAAAEKLARTEGEKGQITVLSTWMEETLQRNKEAMETRFYEKISELRRCRDQVLAFLKEDELERAEKLLKTLVALHGEIMKIPGLSRELLAENKDLLRSPETLKEVLSDRKNRLLKGDRIMNAVVGAKNFSTMESAVRDFIGSPDNSAYKSEADGLKGCLKEITYFKAILEFLKQSEGTVPGEFGQKAFFRDVQARRDFAGKLKAAKTELIEGFDSLQENTNRQNLIFLRLETAVSSIDIYAPLTPKFPSMASSTNDKRLMEVSFRNTKGARVILKRSRKNFKQISVIIGDETYDNCRLIYPAAFSLDAIRTSRAPHQTLIQQGFTELNRIDENEILSKGIQFLEAIRRDEMCAPYWKMKLALRILEPLAGIDRSTEKTLQQLKNELQKLQELDTQAGDPLGNKFLAEKVDLFFKTYDFSRLGTVLAQNQAIRDFYKAQTVVAVRYLTLPMKVKGVLKYTICADRKDSSGDIFCFDDDVSGILRVGHYDKNDLVIEDRFRDRIAGHLLFTVERTLPYRKLARGRGGIDLKKMNWPEFWPRNMRGE